MNFFFIWWLARSYISKPSLIILVRKSILSLSRRAWWSLVLNLLNSLITNDETLRPFSRSILERAVCFLRPLKVTVECLSWKYLWAPQRSMVTNSQKSTFYITWVQSSKRLICLHGGKIFTPTLSWQPSQRNSDRKSVV